MSMTANMGRPDGWDAARQRAGACLMADALFDGQEIRIGACLRIVGNHASLCDRPDAGPEVLMQALEGMERAASNRWAA